MLVRRATDILADVAATEHELAGLRDRLAGRLTIGAYPTAAMALVPRAIAEVAAGHPGLAVVLEEGSTPALLRWLRRGGLEVAVIGVGHDLPDYDLGELRQVTLPQGDLLVVVPDTHRFANHDAVTVPEPARERWVVGAGAAGEPQFGAWPTLAEPDIAHTARNWSTRLGMVAAGLGLTVIPISPTGPADGCTGSRRRRQLLARTRHGRRDPTASLRPGADHVGRPAKPRRSSSPQLTPETTPYESAILLSNAQARAIVS